jgi:predicted transglutaminase-like cysteine proteinase
MRRLRPALPNGSFTSLPYSCSQITPQVETENQGRELSPVKTALKALALIGAWLAMAPSISAQPVLLGTTEFRAPSLTGLPHWQRVLQRIEVERRTYRACAAAEANCPSRGAAAWQVMIRNQAGRAPLDQLDTVNRFLNGWHYKEDPANYGRRDYWATPLEFLLRSGDCEDYAIAKYVTLRQLGFPAERLRLVVVHDMVRDLAHAVLAVYLDDQVYILDNLIRAVLPQEEITHYVPYYSVNETTRWAHVTPVDTLVSSSASSHGPTAASR